MNVTLWAGLVDPSRVWVAYPVEFTIFFVIEQPIFEHPGDKQKKFECASIEHVRVAHLAYNWPSTNSS